MTQALELFNYDVHHIIEQFRGVTPDVRHWSSMPAYFGETPQKGADPVIYELYGLPYTASPTDLMVVLTVLRAGTIGSEKFHTKGHFHHEPDGAEYVITLSGTGVLECGARDGTITKSSMKPGTHLSVAPGEAHRVVNTGRESLAFISVCSPVIGHDYDSVEQLGWVKTS